MYAALCQVFVRALAMLKDASKQSSVVTKRFTVYKAKEADNDESEEEEMVRTNG